MFEELNVTLRKGQRRVNGWRQRLREGEFFFVVFLTCKDEFESVEENVEVMKSCVGRLLAGKPCRHAVELCNVQVFVRV